MKGTVLKSTGSFYDIAGDDGRKYKGRIRGKFRIKGLKTTNPVAVGDRVEFELRDDGTALITDILPRKNYLLRKATNLSRRYHILASNIDQVFVLYTPAYPETLLPFIDRILVSAEAYGIPPVLVINKIDLFRDDPEMQKKIARFKEIYGAAGYPVIETSAVDGTGLDKLKALMKDKTSMFTGNSGTGKSSLINAVAGLNIRTKPVSHVHRQGQHTTTFAEMHALPFGGYIIDTPGVRAFGTADIQAGELDMYFPEFRPHKPKCKFHNCKHVNEPQCGVQEAVEEGLIAPERFLSYLDILDEIENNDGPYRTKKFG
ncbi:MAG: ribosome small subunit-dependent GTPase A [Chlorobi bacterium]|nr:ribosome small subunit-dependent GTPase A [Chlorobiota bacterium]